MVRCSQSTHIYIRGNNYYLRELLLTRLVCFDEGCAKGRTLANYVGSRAITRRAHEHNHLTLCWLVADMVPEAVLLLLGTIHPWLTSASYPVVRVGWSSSCELLRRFLNLT
jgi:hypothetical protein